MNIISKFSSIFNKFTPAETTESRTSFLGEVPEISLKQIVKYRKSDLQFRLAVMTFTSYSVGNGFTNSADTSIPSGRNCLKLIDDFCHTWNLDELNQAIGLDVWSTGNAFLSLLGKSNRLEGIQILPLSSITNIKRDGAGTIQSYVQQWGGTPAELDPELIAHFKWMAEDSNAFGTGTGQSLATKGVGYNTANGTIVQRPSQFQINEMIQDVSAKITYAGVPQWLIKTKKNTQGISNLFNKLDPLQHIASNDIEDTSTISLDTNTKFDSFLRNLSDNAIAGYMSPVPRLFSNFNFSYASSKEAVEAMMPLIRMYQRAHKRFIETNLYNPLIIQEGKDPKKVNVKLSWGMREPYTIDDIVKIHSIVKDPMFSGSFDPTDILKMMQEAGIPINIIEKVKDELTPQLKSLSNLLTAKDEKIPLTEIADKYL